MATTVGSLPDTQRSGPRRSVSGSTRGQSLAQGLGWFSLGLGAAQVIAPRAVARLIGVDDSDRNTAIMRACGMREIASGMGIFSQRNDHAFLWARVIGDVMDLALIGAAAASPRTDKRRLAGAAIAVLGAAALDAAVARQRSNPEVTDVPRTTDWRDELTDGAEERDNGRVRKTITINKPQDEVTRMWADVTRRAEVGEQLNGATVSFQPGPRDGETEVHVEIAYEPRGGKLGAAVSRLAHRDPGARIQQDLRHAKQIFEVGEVVHSDASIHRGPHPAQPSAEAQIR